MKNLKTIFELLIILFCMWPFGVALVDLFWYAITEHQLTALNWKGNAVLSIWLIFSFIFGIILALSGGEEEV